MNMARRILVAALLMVISLTCYPAIRATTLFVGDSLFALSMDNISYSLTETIDPPLLIFDVRSGRGLKDNWPPRVADIQAEVGDFDLVFINLGINDLSEYAGAPVVESQIESLLDEFPASTKVYWILPHNTIVTFPGYAFGAAHEEMRQLITFAAQSRSNVYVLDFDLWVALRGLDIVTLIGYDGVHLTASGEAEYSVMVKDVIYNQFPVEGDLPIGPPSGGGC
jgi:hypothetical protein